jgi:hypothetical protein
VIFGVNWSEGPLFVLGEVGLVVISSLPLIYGVTLLVCLPAYALIRRAGDLKVWHPTSIGAVLGAAVSPLTENPPHTAQRVGLAATVGLSAGALFWVLWRPRPEKPLQRTGLALRR